MCLRLHVGPTNRGKIANPAVAMQKKPQRTPYVVACRTPTRLRRDWDIQTAELTTRPDLRPKPALPNGPARAKPQACRQRRQPKSNRLSIWRIAGIQAAARFERISPTVSGVLWLRSRTGRGWRDYDATAHFSRPVLPSPKHHQAGDLIHALGPRNRLQAYL